jgi:hypothetical protein
MILPQMNSEGRPNLHVRVSLRSIAVANALLLVISWGPIAVLSGFVAALGLITLPILVGFAIRGAYIEARRRSETPELNLRSAFKSWLLGLIAITASASFVSILLAPIAFDVAGLISLIGLGYCILRGGAVKTPDIVLTPRLSASVGSLLLGSIVPFWYLRRLAPFPFMPASDFFVHLVQISSTLGGASGLHLWDNGFITMVASSSALAHSEPLWTLWIGPIFQYLAFSLGIYWLARKFIRNNWLCLASALLPLWFMGDGLANDLIFLLRPLVMMCLVPFAIAMVSSREERDGEIKVAPIAISGMAALFFHFDVSAGVYNLFTARLPLFLQDLLQPGFVITAPAYTFGLPSAVIQDFYAALVSTALFFLALRMSGAHERKILAWWFLITCAGVLIEYTVGILLSIVLLGFLVLRRYSSSRLPPILGVFGLGIIGILLTGKLTPYRVLQSTLAPLAHILSQGLTANSLNSLQLLIAFLYSNYGTFDFDLFLLSLASLSILSWHDKSARTLVYVPIFGLVLYFSPFPYSYFFLILVTPFVGIAISLALVRFYSFVNSLGAGGGANSVHGPPNAGFVKSIRTRRPRRIDPPKAVFVAVVCVIFLIIGSSITQPYDYNIGVYRTAYGSQTVTSFTAQDLSAADWLKNNFPPTTLIISDPTTTEILAGFAGLPYTMEGHVALPGPLTYLETHAYLITDVNTTLFRSVVANLSARSFTALIGLYHASDKYMGFDSSRLKVVLVMNNRTSWWANGSESYPFANSFVDFPGFAAYSKTSFVSSAFNVSATYRIYTLMIPQGVTIPGTPTESTRLQSPVELDCPSSSYSPCIVPTSWKR